MAAEANVGNFLSGQLLESDNRIALFRGLFLVKL
jgi:hypothetical protein